MVRSDPVCPVSFGAHGCAGGPSGTHLALATRGRWRLAVALRSEKEPGWLSVGVGPKLAWRSRRALPSSLLPVAPVPMPLARLPRGRDASAGAHAIPPQVGATAIATRNGGSASLSLAGFLPARWAPGPEKSRPRTRPGSQSVDGRHSGSWERQVRQGPVLVRHLCGVSRRQGLTVGPGLRLANGCDLATPTWLAGISPQFRRSGPCPCAGRCGR